MGCTKISKTNKGESNLFNTIYNGVANGNEQLATHYYNWFESKRFEELFGFNYINAYKKDIQNERLDENGEPKLLHDKETSKYYFLDKNNLKSYFPSSSKGLSKTWSGQQIKNVTSRLVSSYFKRYSNIDFNNIDFSTLTNLPNLDKFIKHEIDKKIAKLNEIVDNGTEDEADVALAKLGYLEDASKNLNELKELVVKKFKDIGADYSEDEDNDDYSEDIKETSREGVVGKASIERSSRSKVTANVKLRLSLLDDLENKDELWDDFTLLEFDKVYKKLQELLSNKIPLEGEFLYDNFVKIIKENVKYFPYLKQLNQMLADNKDENFPYEFTQAFYKAKNTFVNEEYIKNEKGYTQNTRDLSNRTDKKVIIKNNLIQGFTNKFIVKDTNGNLILFDHTKQVLLDSIKSLKEMFNRSATLSNKDKADVKKIEDFKIFTLNTLKKLGLNISDKGFNHYIDYPVDKTLEESTIEERIEIFNKLYNLVAKLSNYAFKEVTVDVNKIFNSTNEFNNLIDSEVFVSDNDMSEDMIQIGGEKRYVFSNPSHLHMELERWKQDPSILLKEYYSDPYMEGARLVKEWFELDINQDKSFEELVEIGRKNLKNVKLGVLGEMTLGGVKNKFEKTTDLGIKDYFTNNINSVLKNQGFVRTITQADKSTEFTFKTLVNRIKGYLGYNTTLNEFEITDEVKKTYFNYYLSELKRALRANQVVDEAIKNNDYSQLTPHYHFQYEIKDKDGNTIINPNRFDKSGNAFKSQYFDKLNVKTAKTDIEKEIVDIVYNKDGSLKIKDLSTFTLNDLELESKFGEYLQKMITSEARETLKEMKNLGIIEVKNGKYSNKLLDTNLVEENTSGTGEIGMNNAINKIAINYMINGISNNIEFTKLFTGDIAYYKNPVDFKKRVPATYTDGKYLLLKEGEEAFNIATIEAVMQDSPFLKALKEDNNKNGVDAHTIEMLSNINSTDAQAWITPERWKFLKVRLGEWSKAHDEVYRKMQSDKNEEWSKEELKLAAQPVKGVYFYKINGKPTYLKYSQAVLSKAMIKGTDLERVFNKMVENKIDELITFDGVKVGSITPTKIHDENGKLLSDEQLTFNVQTLNNHGWKLQQDLPVKNFKNTDVGSQIQKNILAGLKHFLENSNFTFKGKKITGEELQNELVKTVGNLSDEGYRRLINKSGIDKDGKITNTRKFYKSLITELKSRGGSENLINALESETSLFGIPQATGKIFQIFASMINKSIIKIQTNGGSFIQMADFGLSLDAVTKGNSGVVLNPNIDGLKPPMIRTNEDGSRTVTPGSVFVPASFIAKYIPNWKDYTAHELFVSYNGGHPIIDHRIQENIIGYRIPNQGLPSNDALTIAGILPEAAGDTIVAYVGITSKTGSDYDIDKMYIMFPQYEKVIDKTQEEAVFEQIEKNFRGINNEETLSNYKNFLDKFEELDNETLSSDFISDYKNIENKEDRTLFLRDVRKELIKQIVNNIDSKQVKSIFKELKFKTIGLKYSTKGFQGEQNKLIEIYKSVLTNPEVYSDIMKSIDNDFIKKEINSLKPDETSSFMNAMNPRDDVKLRYSFLGGKAGVGMEANAMTDIWRTGKLVISNLANFTWGNYDKTTKETELDKEYSEELSEEDLNYYVSQMVKEDASKERVEEFKNSIRKVKIGETLGTILNAFVDIAKDPYISKGNWTTSTTNVGNLMMRMGVHPLYVINFLGNPIIEEYNQFQQNNEGLFDNNSGDIFNKFKGHIIEKSLGDINSKFILIYKTYFNTLNKDTFKKIKEEILNLENGNNLTEQEFDLFVKESERLYDEVYKPQSLNLFDRTTEQYNKNKLNLEYFRNSIKNKDSVDLNFRITLLNEFRNIQSSSKFLKSIVDFGKLDVNGIGKDPNMIFQYEDLLKEILENAEKTIDENGKPIKGVIKGFESKLDNTILAKYYNNLLKVKTILEQNPSMFPMSIESVRGIIKTMVDDITKSYSKKEEVSEKISKQFRTYIYSKVFDIQDSDRKKVIDNMPKYLQKFQLENKGKYFMIDNLNVVGTEIGLNNSDRSLEFQRMFTNSWEQLFEDHPQFAESLVKYSYLTSGFNSNRTQFYSYIPFEYFIKLNINGKLNDIFSKGNFDEFENKFYLNNLNDTSIVKNVLASDVSVTPNNENGLISEKNKGQFITVNNEYYRLIGKNEDNSFVYIKINNTPVTNDYNVELQLNSFDDSILKVGELLEQQEEQPVNLEPETKQEVKSEVNNIEVVERYSIEDVKANPNKIYVFGDNLQRTGTGGQAIIRNNENTFGIATKLKPTRNEDAYMSDDNIDMNRQNIDSDINKIKNDGRIIVFPKDGLGTGLAKLKEKAPQTYGYLTQRLLEEFRFNNNTGEIISNKPQQLSLFDQLEQDKQRWEEVKNKWIESGRTEADFNSMSNEEREHTIKNCLGL
jgi:hypothetical protein